MNTLPSKCPLCGSEIVVTRFHCPKCDTTVEGGFYTGKNPFATLTPEQMQFMLTFVRCEGRFNRMEEEMRLSYPTLRSRLNDIIRALGYEPGKDETAVRLSPEERRKILEDLDQGTITWAEAQKRLAGKKDETAAA